jgi:hypothetical protein
MEAKSGDTKSTLAASIKPRERKVKIKTFRPSKNNKVVLDFPTEEDLKKIMNDPNIQRKFKVERPKRKQPKMIPYDVDADMTAEQISELFVEQNNLDPESFKLLFKTGPKDRATVHWVMEVTPQTRVKILEAGGRLYLGHSSVKTKDFLIIPRCIKCNDLGHVQKYCQGEETCAKCGDKGHKKAACTKERVCIPCKKRKQTCTHPRSAKCETQRFLLNRELENTNYGP